MTLDLFPRKTEPKAKTHAPLADRMRPRTVAEIVGQEAVLGPDRPLRLEIESDQIPSLIFWGPPGSGKTTIARVVAHETQAAFFGISAVLSGVKELKEVIGLAKARAEGQKTILFVDEIHRWNKAQQDALLPHIEDGTITLIGATTQNPSFELIAPLLSRTKVLVLEPLTNEHLKMIVQRAATDRERGLGRLGLSIEPKALEAICATSDGDARRALNTLEIASTLSRKITPEVIEGALQKKSLLYDKAGEEHYNLISAFIKSMRGSDPDASLYWLARMLEAGEDPLFLARRMVIFASEDIGNADPQALPVAVAAQQAYDFVGLPEGWIPLAQAASYLASAPKSKASYLAYLKAKEDVEKEGALPVPLPLRNPVTPLMDELGYGKGPKVQFLPDRLVGRHYYDPPAKAPGGPLVPPPRNKPKTDRDAPVQQSSEATGSRGSPKRMQ